MNAHSSEQFSASFQGFAPSGSTLCPGCDYDLRGLPAEYKCPECGLEYDLDTMVWTCRVPLAHHILMIIAFSAYFLMHLMSRGLKWPVAWWFMIGLYLLLVIGHLWMLVRKYRHVGRLALTPAGLICNGKTHLHTKRIDWSEIDAIDVQAKRHGLALNKFAITYPTLQSIDITPFEKSREKRYELMSIVEDHRRKRLGLKPRKS